MSKLEEIARAMFPGIYDTPPDDWRGQKFLTVAREDAENKARSAVEAMREPGNAASELHNFVPKDKLLSATVLYTAMIDAILNEKVE